MHILLIHLNLPRTDCEGQLGAGGNDAAELKANRNP